MTSALANQFGVKKMRGIEREPIVILSLSMPYDVNGAYDTAEKIGAITGLHHEAVLGCYEGVQEASVMLSLNTWHNNEAQLVELLNAFDQECILFVDGQRNAWLCNAPAFDNSTSAVRKFLGELHSKPKSQWTTPLPKAYTEVNGNIHYVR